MTDFSETLIAPDGREFVARSAAEYNDLRFGQGYRPASEVNDKPAETTSTTTTDSKADSTDEQNS